jgi:prepilin-type N-terminal cleavage/methylation domain-containing protein
MRRPQAFTLIEMIIAIAIAMVILMLALPSVAGILADRRLRRSLDGFNRMVHQAQEHSYAEHRNYLIAWNGSAIEAFPEVFRKDEEPAPVARMVVKKGESLVMKFPAALIKEPPAEWIFWSSGTSEPALIQYTSRDGTWTADYSGLSTRPELKKYVAR